MFCGNCGHQFADGAAFCPECGAPVNAQQAPVYQAPVYEAAPVSAAPMSKKEFWASLSKKERSNITTASIMCYISAGLTLVLGLVSMNIFALIDVLLVGGLGLWLHLSKSTVAAWLITAYAAFNTIFTLVTTGTPGGWLVLMAGIYAIIGCRKFNKAHKAQAK